MNPRKIKLLDYSDTDLNKDVEAAFAESFQKHFYKKYGVHPKGVIAKAGDGQYTVHLDAGWLAGCGITVDMEDNSMMSVVNADVNELLNHVFPVNEKQLINFRKDVFTFYKNSITDGLDISEGYIEDEKRSTQEALNFVHATVRNPHQRSRYITVLKTYLNEVDSIFKEADKSIDGIILFELEREKERFINEEDFGKAVLETIKFFRNNNHRSKEKIATRKGIKAIAKAYYQIRNNTGRTDIALAKDNDYLEFIKSLFSAYDKKDNNQVANTMQKG